MLGAQPGHLLTALLNGLAFKYDWGFEAKHILFLKQSAADLQQHLQVPRILSIVMPLLGMPNVTYARDRPTHGYFFKKAVTNNLIEELFMSRETASIWRRALGLSTGRNHMEVVQPGARAVILVRTDGTSKRRMTNLDAVVETVKLIYSEDTSVVTLNFSSTFEDHIAVFANTSLVVSPHASQLKSMMYARPGTAFLEMGVMFDSTAFEVSSRHLDCVYEYSLNHTLVNSTTTPNCGRNHPTKHCDYEVKIDKFILDLERLMQRQQNVTSTLLS